MDIYQKFTAGDSSIWNMTELAIQFMKDQTENIHKTSLRPGTNYQKQKHTIFVFHFSLSEKLFIEYFFHQFVALH